MSADLFTEIYIKKSWNWTVKTSRTEAKHNRSKKSVNVAKISKTVDKRSIITAKLSKTAETLFSQNFRKKIIKKCR